MKNLRNLKGVKALNKKEQQTITGGNWLDEIECISNGGTWVSIGGDCSIACGCVYGDKPNDKYK